MLKGDSGLKIRKSVPTIASLISLCCGFACIFSAIEGYFDIAAWLIVLSMIFDSLDGKLARLTKTSSSFGTQLDSLVDMVVFGVAPIVLVGQLCKDTYPIVVWVVCFFYLSCAVFRLAKFNEEHVRDRKPSKYFTGLPTTISGGTIAQLTLLHQYLNDSYGITAVFEIIPPITFVLGILMVSKLRFFNIMAKISVKQGIFPFGLEIGGAVILFIINPRIALSISLSAYILVCGLLGLRKKDVSSEQVDVKLSNL